MRDEYLNTTVSLSLLDARGKAPCFLHDYNEMCPHGSLGWLTPAEFAAHPANQLLDPLPQGVVDVAGGGALAAAATGVSAGHAAFGVVGIEVAVAVGSHIAGRVVAGADHLVVRVERQLRTRRAAGQHVLLPSIPWRNSLREFLGTETVIGVLQGQAGAGAGGRAGFDQAV
ncbi:MAG: integrase core domain-containing protein [Terriglobales bacterium]